jgi:hypothetical protein
MADLKISALTASTIPLAGTEVLPIVQSGTTKQVSVANLTAGRAISATQLTLSTGSLIVANGQGIDFSATPGTGTSELFADYEEGTWTPTQGAGLTVVGTFSSSGTYTKIGRSVTVTAVLNATTSLALASTGGVLCGAVPFSASGQAIGAGTNGAQTIAYTVLSNDTRLFGTTTIAASTSLTFTCTYIV